MAVIELLAPGRSLRRYYPAPPASWPSTVVAVNRAAYLYECDWLAFLDRVVIEDLPKDKRPKAGYITGTNLKTPDGGKRIKPWTHGKSSREIEGFEALYGDHAICNYTFPNALYACCFGQVEPDVKLVRIFGADFGSGLDVAGGGGNRGAKRYRRELAWVSWIARNAECLIEWYSDMDEPIREVLEDGKDYQTLKAYFWEQPNDSKMQAKAGKTKMRRSAAGVWKPTKG